MPVDLVKRQFRRRRPNQALGLRLQCAAASGVGDERRKYWPLALGLQEQGANHRKRLGSKALVVSVAEKVPEASGENQRRRTPVNCRSSVESTQTTSKPGVEVNPGSAWREPADWPCGVRHRGSAILVRAPMLNCGNLRPRCEGKGSSAIRKAETTNTRSRGGAARSSAEVAVMVMERRGRVIESVVRANCISRRSLGE